MHETLVQILGGSLIAILAFSAYCKGRVDQRNHCKRRGPDYKCQKSQ